MTSVEQKSVINVYSKIADHFDQTRFNQWSWITDFIENTTQKTKTNVLDIGCGNGRNMEGFKNADVYGIDNCEEFVKICTEKNKNVVQADMTNIPFKDDYFDYLISIASFHHLSTKERRIKALNEMKRVAKPGALMLISVWSLEQPPKTKQAKNITHYGDTLIKWNKFGEEYERYYYIFRLAELRELFEKTGWNVQKHFWDYGNEIFIIKN